ncbi:MAG: hypothetical protein HY975_02755 [Candidatus Kerfeldbacteria bacterium]|nr:hypothetical protein [Candidatus Kerfeldbacteria bacterium]
MLSRQAIQAELGRIDAELQANQERNESEKYRFMQLISRRAMLERLLASPPSTPRSRVRSTRTPDTYRDHHR